MSQGPPADLKTIGRAASRAVNIIGGRGAPARLICMVRRCVRVHRYARASVCVFVGVCVSASVRGRARGRACVRVYACVCARKYAYLSARVCVCVYVCVRVCVRVRSFVCARLYVCVLRNVFAHSRTASACTFPRCQCPCHCHDVGGGFGNGLLLEPIGSIHDEPADTLSRFL